MIILILAVAAILRLIVSGQSLWLDEAINVNNAANLGFKTLIFDYSLGDFHPPFYHIILRAWILMFGSSEIVVRMPSVIFGVATVFVTYLIGKKLFEEKTALIAATLLSTGPLHIYYSQEARMYMLAGLLASLSVFFFVSIIAKDTVWSWLGFVIATSLMLYSDYLPYLLIVVFIIYLFIRRKQIPKATFRAFLPAFILILILWTPWLLVLPKQLAVGLSAAAASPAWSYVVGAPTIKGFLVTFVKFTIGRINYQNDLIYALLFAPAAIFVVFLFLFSLFRMSFQRFFLWFWVFGCLFLGFMVSFFVPIFAYFRFVFVLPAFYLIWASTINTVNWVSLTRVLLGLALIINLVSASLYFVNPKFQRENWRMATSYVIGNSTAKSIILFESPYTFAPFDYYAKGKINGAGALDSFNADQSKVKEKVTFLTRDKNHVFLFQYLSQITDPQGLVFKELTNLGFSNLKTKDFEGVGFIYEFRR